MIKINKITTELMVDNINESVAFYKNILGFEINVSVPEPDPFFVILQTGSVELMLYHRTQFSEEIPKFKKTPIGASMALYIDVEDIDIFYRRVKDKVKIVQQLHDTAYGSKEFSCEDSNGYLLMFSERN